MSPSLHPVEPPAAFAHWFAVTWPPPGPRAAEAPTPAFQPANYTFTVTQMTITETRSVHEDTDGVSASIAVGDSAPVTDTKALGDVNNGEHPISLTVGPVAVTDPNVGVACNYLIVNAGHASWATVDGALTTAGQALASQGAKAATQAVGSAIGAYIGSAALPVVGTILGAAAGWLVSELASLAFADCDGPVAAEQPAFKGIDLWNRTQNPPVKLPWAPIELPGHSFGMVTQHPGVDSAAGCGSNSQYSVGWRITRV